MTTSSVAESANGEVFPTIGTIAASEEHLPTVVESLCMECHETGTTTLLLAVIPFFKEVVISSFSCPHCGHRTSETMPAGEIQLEGKKYTLVLNDRADLDRRIKKSEHATFRLEELDFEIPEAKGRVTTIEGLLRSALDELQSTQDDRRKADAAVAEKVEDFVAKLAMCLAGLSFPLTVVLDDPSGNSFIENPNAPKSDPALTISSYSRTPEQNKAVGVEQQEKQESEKQGTDGVNKEGNGFNAPDGSVINPDMKNKGIEKEVLGIPSDCPNCQAPGMSQMCMTDIPFFKEVLIMAFNCESCGFKNNEVKGGGAISQHGKKISLSVPAKLEAPDEYSMDMGRDVVKSTSAGILIPEIELEVTHGSLGGMYTTVEGLLQKAYNELFDADIAEFYKGDSAQNTQKLRFGEFEKTFKKILEGEIPFTLIIDDPLDNSYMYSPTAPEPEPRLTIETYTRDYDMNEEFGLNQMNTENYYEEDSTNPDSEEANQNADIPIEAGFEPSCTFNGPKFGKVFKKGVNGLGYYSDSIQAARDTQQHMVDLQEKGKEAHPNKDVVAVPDI